MDVIHDSIDNCAKELHAWGEANQVKFDPTKESRAILSAWNQAAEGSSFELLGVIIDPQLTMKPAIEALVKKCRWKLASVLRCRRFYCPRDLVQLYKSRLLGYIEYRTAAIYHAATSNLDRLDSIQRQMLAAVGLSSAEALFLCNLAPLET